MLLQQMCEKIYENSASINSEVYRHKVFLNILHSPQPIVRKHNTILYLLMKIIKPHSIVNILAV